jgi:hypothetical protein
VALALAAILAEGLASPVNWLLRASAGFILHPVGYAPAAPCAWPKHVYVTAEGLLALFGAKPQGTPIELAFALVHLAGVVLVVRAMLRVARHFASWPDRISQILLVTMIPVRVPEPRKGTSPTSTAPTRSASGSSICGSGPCPRSKPATWT